MPKFQGGSGPPVPPSGSAHLAPMKKFISDSTENFVRKGENTGYQHFLLFSLLYHKLLSQGH